MSDNSDRALGIALVAFFLLLFATFIVAASVFVMEQRAHAQAFGQFSDAYLARKEIKERDLRWRDLCKGGGRYQAMSEAYALGKPDPCNPKAKEWKR